MNYQNSLKDYKDKILDQKKELLKEAIEYLEEKINVLSPHELKEEKDYHSVGLHLNKTTVGRLKGYLLHHARDSMGNLINNLLNQHLDQFEKEKNIKIIAVDPSTRAKHIPSYYKKKTDVDKALTLLKKLKEKINTL